MNNQDHKEELKERRSRFSPKVGDRVSFTIPNRL
jgi:hypothetical protein